MSATGVVPNGGCSNEPLRDAFSQTHNAVQWLARMVRSFRSVNGGDDIILHWNEERKAFLTDQIVGDLQMELRIPELTLQFLENGKPVDHQLQMEGRSPAHVEAWVLVELLHRGIDRDRFSKDLPYDIPNPMVGDSVEYSPEFREGELRRMLDWFVAATGLMKDLVREAAEHAVHPELLLRSRDFSLEATIAPDEKTGTGAIRLGFCPLRQGKVGPHYIISRSFKEGSADVVEIVTVPLDVGDGIASPAIAARLREIIRRAQDR